MRRATLKRILQTVSIDPSAVDRIDTIAGETGLSRGRVIEAALAEISTCSHCDGTGKVEVTKRRVQDRLCGPFGECPACWGKRIVRAT